MTALKQSYYVCNDRELRALVDGQKTQIRRVLNFNTQALAYEAQWHGEREGGRWRFTHPNPNRSPFYARCFTQPSALLFVREAYRVRDIASDFFTVVYRATIRRGFTDTSAQLPTKTLGDLKLTTKGWRQANHMPPQASRFTLLIKEVRLQRLEDMTEVDAQTTGYPSREKFVADFYVQHSMRLWGDNPWFTVADVELVRANILTQELAA